MCVSGNMALLYRGAHSPFTAGLKGGKRFGLSQQAGVRLLCHQGSAGPAEHTGNQTMWDRSGHMVGPRQQESRGALSSEPRGRDTAWVPGRGRHGDR